MLRLINNELRKQFGRKITWIMMILLAVIAVGAVLFSLLCSLLSNFSVIDLAYGDGFRDSIEENRKYYQNYLDTAVDATEDDRLSWQTEVEYCNIILDSDIESWTDWRVSNDLIYHAVDAKITGDAETYNTLLQIIKNNDTKAYFEFCKKNYATLYTGEELKNYEYAMDYCIQNEVIPSADEDWRFAMISEWLENQSKVLQQEALKENGGAWSAEILEEAKNRAAIAQYQLEHNMEANPVESFNGGLLDVLLGNFIAKKTSAFWDAMSQSVSLITIVGIITIVIAGSSVANEFSSGTVKFLLIAPVKRWKILLSKYLSILIMAFGMMILLFVCTWIPALLLGPMDAFMPTVSAVNGEVQLTSPYLTLFSKYALSGLTVLLMSSLSFAISSLARSSALSIGVSLALYLMGNIASLLLYAFGFDWGRWFLFSNLDFVAIANGSSIFPHQSLFVAVLIVVAHMAVFLLTAYDAFTRKEV